MISPAKLFLLGKPLDKAHMMLNKYTFMGFRYNFPHYRIITIGDLVSNKLVKDKDLPKYVYDFIGVNGEVLMIANIIDKHIPMLQLRTIRGEKAFSVFGSQTRLFYGLGMINPNFKYGDWLVICEGLMDVDALRSVYPNVVGCMTAGLTNMQLEILKLMTNRVILSYDNDKAGRTAYKRDSKKLKELGFEVKCLIQYDKFKDSGDLASLLYKQEEFDFNIAYRYYKNKIDYITR